MTLNPAQFYTLYRPKRCEKRLYLDYKGVEASPPDAYTQVLFRLGQRHEKAHLATFPFYEDLSGAPFEKTIEKLKQGSPVIYHGELRLQTTIDGQEVQIVGIPDFIVKDEKKRHSIIEEILKYNEEDLQATWAVFERTFPFSKNSMPSSSSKALFISTPP